VVDVYDSLGVPAGDPYANIDAAVTSPTDPYAALGAPVPAPQQLGGARGPRVPYLPPTAVPAMPSAAGHAPPNWFVRQGIATPESPVGREGLLGALESAPRRLYEYFRDTPSAIEQSAEIRKRAQAAGGLSTPEGRAILIQDPMLYGFAPGEGLARSVPGLNPGAALERPPPALQARPNVPPPEAAPFAEHRIPAAPPARPPVYQGGIRGEPFAPPQLPARVTAPEQPGAGMAGAAEQTRIPFMAAETGPAEAMRPALESNINLYRINSPDEIQAVIRGTGATNREFTEARRGVIPLQQTADMAGELGMTPDALAKRLTGQAFNAEQAVAARHLMVKSAQNVFDLAQRARGGSDADLAAFEQAVTRHRAIQEQVAGMTAEAGRALSAFRIMVGEGGNNVALLRKLIEQGGGRDRLMRMADHVVNLPPDKVGRFVTDTYKPTLRDKAFFVWINALVSNPASHAANVLSNTAVSLWHPIEAATAAAISKLTPSGRAGGHMFGEVPRLFAGMVQGVQEGLTAAWQTMKTGQPASGLSKLEEQRPAPIGGIPGAVIGVPTRALAAEDELFKAIAYRARLNADALMAARGEGLSGKALADRAEQLRANPTDKMIESASHLGAAFHSVPNRSSTSRRRSAKRCPGRRALRSRCAASNASSTRPAPRPANR